MHDTKLNTKAACSSHG